MKKEWEDMRTCAECKYAELQCPPVIRCIKKSTFHYLDSLACEQFEPVEEKEKL